MSRWDAEVEAWIAGDPDESNREELRVLLARHDDAELALRFAHPLRFGTAGLRGPVMAGPAGMNRYSVRRATQGVLAWLKWRGDDLGRGVVVGRDARHGSQAFADEVVAVLLGAGARVLELPSALPTPFVPYCVTALGAVAGIMITASHNPPQDNGYKLYAADGAQILGPDDEVVERFARAAPLQPPLGSRASDRHEWIEDDVLERYRAHLMERFAPRGGSDLVICYTPLHGVGGASARDLLERAGYRHVHVVDAQFAPDPDFPTLPFPNPEEPGALDLAIRRARETKADLVLANDPDADRLGAAVPDRGEWRVLRGDEIGWLLASALFDAGVAPGDVVATTIVSSTLLEAMARDADVSFALTLTGFKWIARAAGERRLAFGYEEALGFAVDDAVSDKDGLSAALALARLTHDLRARGQTLVDRLDELEERYGVHATTQVSLRLADEGTASRVVAALRAHAPTTLGGLAVREVVDLRDGWRALAPTDGLLFNLGDDGRVVVRPSGTEPKVKFYVEVTGVTGATLDERREAAARRLRAISDDVRALASRVA
ncbi:MAG: phospho-sugar mutase [Acidobacteriota bacterium]|nr:phospho-sugar mutase [Acidobacteriota bacterium]